MLSALGDLLETRDSRVVFRQYQPCVRSVVAELLAKVFELPLNAVESASCLTTLPAFESLHRAKTTIVIADQGVEKPLIRSALLVAFIELAFDQLPEAVDALEGELDVAAQPIGADVQARVLSIHPVFDAVYARRQLIPDP